MNKPDFSKMPDDELSATIAGHADLETKQEMARSERAKRDRTAQHELDRKLILEQVRWMRFSVIAIIVASVLSGLLGLLPWLLSRHQQSQPTAQTTIQVQTGQVSQATSR